MYRRLVSLVVMGALLLSAADRKKAASALPKVGLTKPGVRIPFAKLKPEAEISVPGATLSVFFADAVWVGTKDGLARIDAKANKLMEPIAEATNVCAGMAQGFDTLWATSCATGQTVRLDAKAGKSKASFVTGFSTAVPGIAASADSIWILTDSRGTLTRIDPATNQPVAEFRLPASCNSLTFAESSLWLTCPAEDQVLRVNPQTNIVDKYISVAGAPRSLTVAEGSVWVLTGKEGKVAKVDPKSNKVTATIDLAVPAGEGAITSGGGYLWVTSKGIPLTRIDPRGDSVAQQFVGEGGGDAVAFGINSVWLVDAKAGKVLRFDPKRVLATLAE